MQAIFGPTKTIMSKAIGKTISAHLVSVGSTTVKQPYLFYGSSGPSKPYSSSGWCQMIKQLFKRYSGQALTPKGDPLHLLPCSPPLTQTPLTLHLSPF